MFDTDAQAEASRRDLARFRESGVVSWIEIVNYQCCDECESYPPFVKVDQDPPYPVPGCTNEDGCHCWLAAVIDWGEEDEATVLREANIERDKSIKQHDRREAERVAKRGRHVRSTP